MASRKQKESGQALVEAVVALPVVIAMFTLVLAACLAIGASFILQDRLDETLLCLTVHPQSECEPIWKRVAGSTIFASLSPRATFTRNGTTWFARARIQLPWGRELAWTRELRTPLTENAE